MKHTKFVYIDVIGKTIKYKIILKLKIFSKKLPSSKFVVLYLIELLNILKGKFMLKQEIMDFTDLKLHDK